jgi:hypothetical protein
MIELAATYSSVFPTFGQHLLYDDFSYTTILITALLLLIIRLTTYTKITTQLAY